MLVIIMISIPKAYCSNGNEALNICAVANCLSPAFICAVSGCACLKRHQNCFSNSSFHPIVNKILEKSYQFSNCFNQILDWYDQNIKHLSFERESLRQKMQRINLQGLQEKQKWLLKMLDEGNYQSITGDKVFDVVSSIKSFPKADVFTFKNDISYETNKVKLQLQGIRKLWDDQLDERKKILESCWSAISGQIQLDHTSNFNLSEVTYLAIKSVNLQLVKAIATTCVSLRQLYISNPLSSSALYLSKNDIENLGKYLKNRLRKLAIKSQNMTITQIQAIAKEMPYLQQLLLQDAASVSVKDHISIKKLMPRCDIKFI